jgi:hypothetical protein
MKPLWLLDIDGVVNAVPFILDDTPNTWPENSWIRKDVSNEFGTWPILAAKPVLDFITEIHESGLAEIRWHSSWQEDSLDVGDALGLPTFHIQPCLEAMKNEKFGWWKLHTVLRELADDRTVLWTDDDINVEIPGKTLDMLGSTVGFKVVVPASATGLTPNDLVDIIYFLEENR